MVGCVTFAFAGILFPVVMIDGDNKWNFPNVITDVTNAGFVIERPIYVLFVR